MTGYTNRCLFLLCRFVVFFLRQQNDKKNKYCIQMVSYFYLKNDLQSETAKQIVSYSWHIN